ncbi:Cof-type HAD-IIB family hydrolase [Aquibacillus rhizosphaerae]|uniref:Cof-type HAD-IIB family hydrolase n=1 Tax=Aquibacillus rhizosphaerae TaxID=3051431 RepID=A0ABT7L6D9_9BACI|nr:Cof-type HAD-IIB family hydrolase [Aquibacillus sp. LR5S19]MDL4840160.1 Cof-type HAD-IIB family hydrolase [Aquibacillus sp. LR5S19]
MVLQPKAIFLDMDGTILNHSNQVSNNTKEVIDELREKGIFVFVATGRSFGEIADIVPKGFTVDGIVSSNGMIVHIGNELVVENTLPLDLVNEVIEKARKHKVYYEVFPNQGPRVTLMEDRHYVEAEIEDPKPDSVGINEWTSRKEALDKEIAWKKELDSDKFSKFYFFSKRKDHINMWKSELDELKKKIDFTTSISSEHNVELMVANVNKATGIQHILDEFKLSSKDILVIGDSDNDLPMFEFAGYSVAMKNAPDHIKEVVNEVTEFSCDEDGVCRYLKRFLKNGV